MITRPPHALGGGADSQEYQVGGNFRLSEIAAALALVGVERFPAQAGQREEMASYMDENIFRAGPKGVDDAVAAIRKIQNNAEDLNKAAGELRGKYGK